MIEKKWNSAALHRHARECPEVAEERSESNPSRRTFASRHASSPLTYPQCGTLTREDLLAKLEEVFGDKLEWAVISREFHKKKPTDAEAQPHLHAAVFLNQRPNVRGTRRLDILEPLHPDHRPKHPNIQKVRNMSRWLRYVCKRDREPLCHKCDKDELHILMANNLDRIAMMAWRGDENWREEAREENPGLCMQYWTRLCEWEEAGKRHRAGPAKKGYVVIPLRQKRDPETGERVWLRRSPVMHPHNGTQLLTAGGELLWQHDFVSTDDPREGDDRVFVDAPDGESPQFHIIPIGFKRSHKMPQPVLSAPPNFGKTTLLERMMDLEFRCFLLPRNDDFKGWEDFHFSFACADEFEHSHMQLQKMNSWLDGSYSKFNVKGSGVTKRHNITTFILTNFKKDEIYPDKGHGLRVDEARQGFFKRILYIDGEFYDFFDARFFDEQWKELKPRSGPTTKYCFSCGSYPQLVDPVRLPVQVRTRCNCAEVLKHVSFKFKAC